MDRWMGPAEAPEQGEEPVPRNMAPVREVIEAMRENPEPEAELAAPTPFKEEQDDLMDGTDASGLQEVDSQRPAVDQEGEFFDEEAFSETLARSAEVGIPDPDGSSLASEEDEQTPCRRSTCPAEQDSDQGSQREGARPKEVR